MPCPSSQGQGAGRAARPPVQPMFSQSSSPSSWTLQWSLSVFCRSWRPPLTTTGSSWRLTTPGWLPTTSGSSEFYFPPPAYSAVLVLDKCSSDQCNPSIPGVKVLGKEQSSEEGRSVSNFTSFPFSLSPSVSFIFFFFFKFEKRKVYCRAKQGQCVASTQNLQFLIPFLCCFSFKKILGMRTS